MRELKHVEMVNVCGGANGIVIGTIISVIVTFVVGVLHGYSNPKSCNN